VGAVSGDDDRREPGGSDGIENARVPAPWGEVVIPDDISELAAEADQVRRELRRAHLRRRWGRLIGLTDSNGPALVGPLLIITLAMGVALASLFGGVWPYPSGGNGQSSSRGVGHPVPALTLKDAKGVAVPLHDVHPAVILDVGRCACGGLIAETTTLTNQERLPLLVIGQPKAPAIAAAVKGKDPYLVRSLADPDGRLVKLVAAGVAPKSGTALVVLVATDGTMTQVVNDVQSAEEFATGARRLP
jgi:hypothetical protein